MKKQKVYLSLARTCCIEVVVDDGEQDKLVVPVRLLGRVLAARDEGRRVDDLG